jgi:hypothetical protein
MQFSDEDLRRLRASTEDHFTERKTAADSGDWVKTVVAFANSVPHERPGVLFIGVRDNGTIEQGCNLDTLQRTLRSKLNAVYPPVNYTPRVVSEGSQEYLCVLVPGSASRPHFAGPAFARVGSETVVATQALYDAMIAERNGKTYRIRQFVGKPVRLLFIRSGEKSVGLQGRIAYQHVWELVECDQFSAAFRDHYGERHVFSLDRVDLLTAHEQPGTLVLQIRD